MTNRTLAQQLSADRAGPVNPAPARTSSPLSLQQPDYCMHRVPRPNLELIIIQPSERWDEF